MIRYGRILEDGSRCMFVTVADDEGGGECCYGRLMPQVSDSRQQPKSLAFQLVEERGYRRGLPMAALKTRINVLTRELKKQRERVIELIVKYTGPDS